MQPTISGLNCRFSPWRSHWSALMKHFIALKAEKLCALYKHFIALSLVIVVFIIITNHSYYQFIYVYMCVCVLQWSSLGQCVSLLDVKLSMSMYWHHCCQCQTFSIVYWTTIVTLFYCVVNQLLADNVPAMPALNFNAVSVCWFLQRMLNDFLLSDNFCI